MGKLLSFYSFFKPFQVIHASILSQVSYYYTFSKNTNKYTKKRRVREEQSEEEHRSQSHSSTHSYPLLLRPLPIIGAESQVNDTNNERAPSEAKGILNSKRTFTLFTFAPPHAAIHSLFADLARKDCKRSTGGGNVTMSFDLSAFDSLEAQLDALNNSLGNTLSRVR